MHASPVIGPPPPPFQGCHSFAVRVIDTSMSLATPMRMLPGVDGLFVTTDQPIKSGRIYAIRRRLRPSGPAEQLIRRVRVFPWRVELCAETDELERYPVIRLNGLDWDPTKSVFVQGLLYAIQHVLVD